MEHTRGADRGSYAVVITLIFGAIGLAYGLAQVVGADTVKAANTGETIYLALTTGGVWGVLGLIFGGLISALVNGGFWSIPLILVLALAFQSSIITH